LRIYNILRDFIVLNQDFENPTEELFAGLEDWCIEFNNFMILFFSYLKYIFGFILLIIGILTLMRLRGVYKTHRVYSFYEKKGMVKPRIFLGVFYIVFAFGIFFNFMIYFLMFSLDWLPDRLIFNFLNFSGGIDSEFLNGIKDIEASKYPHERTIYYLICFASFMALLTLVLCLYKIINKEGSSKMDLAIKGMIFAIADGILVGFTICLPLLL